jgi:hypothetical protein
MSDIKELRQLVLALTPREKTEYLQTFGGKGTVHKRIKEILNHFATSIEPFPEGMLKKEFQRHKSLLKKSLLDFLLQEHEASLGFEAELHQQIRLSKYLITREQYDLASKIISETKQKANAFDFHFLVLECLSLERLIARHFLDTAESKRLESKIKEQKQHLQRIEIEIELINFHDSLIIQLQKGPDLSIPAFDFPEELLSPTARRFLLSIKAMLAKKENNIADWKKYRKEIMEISEEKPDWKNIFPTTYLTILSNYGSTLNPKDEGEEMQVVIEKIKRFKPTNELEKASSFQIIRYLEIFICIGQNEFRKAAALEFETEKKLGQYSGKLNKTFELTICINLAVSLWLNLEFEKSLKWTKKILKFKNCEARLDIQRFAYLFGTMVAFDLNNSKELERFSQYGLKPKRASVDLPTSYCKIIKLIAKLESNTKKPIPKTIFVEIKAEMLRPDFPKQLGKDELTIWLEHRISKKPLVEIAKALDA